MKSKENPYVLQFGLEPAQMIPRYAQWMQVENAFFSEGITQRIFMITGVRGSGKTVFMTNVAERCLREGWIVVNVNVSSRVSVVEQIVVELANHKFLKKHININSLSVSGLGLNVQLSKEKKSTNSEFEARELLKIAEKNNYRVLVTIDEVTNSDTIREFSGAFQIWVREKLPVYLLMTGLFENIRELQNEKSLTFLYRCPRIDLMPLQMVAIKDNYKQNLNISDEQARQMAMYTKGYSFAFQSLGYVVWNAGEFNESVLEEYKSILIDLSYEKIWDELSMNDKRVCVALAKSKDGSFTRVREILGWSANQLNPYRRRLINKQIVVAKSKGFVAFTLPLFDEFVLEADEYEYN